jgi:flavin prenyltransferase
MEKKDNNQKIIIAITGASGSIYGVRLLEVLESLKIETHLVISQAAHITLTKETNFTLEQVKALASYNYSSKDIGARISSGSFKTQGMIIAPCSMNSLAKIAGGIENNLVSRAAGVILKERRKLVLMCRESPLHSGHLENMLKLSNYGAIIAPPVPAFYNSPKTIEDLVNHTIARVLDLFDIDAELIDRWNGLS